ncbi:UxaA family hydrolase [Pikeienuella sp. HZG-20]|uniref:UxaA family hydrolase n=1 Tax=Paludibacillus litoralis TaxID=3133267 RepID=UPI0030ED9F69
MKLPETLNAWRREDGRPGIRNAVAVMAAADNMNPLLSHIVARVPGIVALPAAYGRGQLGEDLEITLDSMAGLAGHPNLAGCLIVAFEPASALRIAERVQGRGESIRVLSFLQSGGMQPCIAAAERLLQELQTRADAAKQTPVGWHEMTIGLECGGSDTTSGLFANPALGALTDELHTRGATLIFSEPVECLGGEAALTARACNSEAAEAMLRAIDGYAQIARTAGVELTGINPTADNIAGGLTTIEEKSLGAIAKTGHAPIEGCIGYGARAPYTGLWMMDAPAAAVENLTALAAGGCQITAFVTGSGNPSGHSIMPTLKISANRETARVMRDHLDVDLSDLFHGGGGITAGAERIGAAAAAVIDGAPTAAERLGFLHSNISRFGRSV